MTMKIESAEYFEARIKRVIDKAVKNSGANINVTIIGLTELIKHRDAQIAAQAAETARAEERELCAVYLENHYYKNGKIHERAKNRRYKLVTPLEKFADRIRIGLHHIYAKDK